MLRVSPQREWLGGRGRGTEPLSAQPPGQRPHVTLLFLETTWMHCTLQHPPPRESSTAVASVAASVAAAQSGGGGQQTVVASGVRGGPRQIARRRRRRLWWRWRRFRFGGDERTRGYTASMWASASASPYGLRTPPTRWLLPPLSYLRTRRGLESEMMERRGWVGGGGRHACARAVGYTGSVRGAGGVDKMQARWVGRASGAPIVDLGVLVAASMRR